MSTQAAWFRLYDSADGMMLQGTGATTVSLSPSAVVDDLRDAVQSEYADSLLKSIPAGALQIFRNKAAFDKRNDPEAAPLDPTLAIGGLGNEEDMLVVAIPPSVRPARVSFPSFVLCDLPFYNDISRATERDGWLMFEHTIPSTSLSKLYIRESYRTIANSIKPGVNKAIVTGTPGIGQSLFLIYLLWTLLKENKRVLFVYHPHRVYYD